jgi:hypothetical protein
MRRLRRQRPQRGDNRAPTADPEPQDLSELFATPRWLRDLGTSAWSAVGVTLFVVGAVWILALTQTIVAPVITAAVVAAVAHCRRRGGPAALAAEQRHHVVGRSPKTNEAGGLQETA